MNVKSGIAARFCDVVFVLSAHSKKQFLLQEDLCFNRVLTPCRNCCRTLGGLCVKKCMCQFWLEYRNKIKKKLGSSGKEEKARHRINDMNSLI